MLMCPVCKKKIRKIENRYLCDKGHSFDVAKQGYTNLYLKSSKNSGDNKKMVEARNSFLHMRFYQPLVDSLISLIKSYPHELMVDAGCGEGYYTNQIQKAFHNNVYAFDLSKEALKYASRQNKEVHYFLSSIFELPMASGSADMILNIFAPFAEKEYARVLKEEGYLIKVDPNEKHLKEMKEVLYDEVQWNDVLSLNSDEFTLVKHEEVNFQMELNQDEISTLYHMTPYSYKSEKLKSETLQSMEHLSCFASFIIYVYKKNK